MERHPGDQTTEVLPALEIFSVGQHHGEYFSETDLDRMAEASLAEGCLPQVAAVPIEAIEHGVDDRDATATAHSDYEAAADVLYSEMFV